MNAEFSAQLRQRVDRVCRAGAPRFAVVVDEERIACDGEPYHRETVGDGGARHGAMRRRAGRDEAHFGELQTLGCFLRQPEMPVVHGIESAAEDAYWAGAQHALRGEE